MFWKSKKAHAARAMIQRSLSEMWSHMVLQIIQLRNSKITNDAFGVGYIIGLSFRRLSHCLHTIPFKKAYCFVDCSIAASTPTSSAVLSFRWLSYCGLHTHLVSCPIVLPTVLLPPHLTGQLSYRHADCPFASTTNGSAVLSFCRLSYCICILWTSCQIVLTTVLVSPHQSQGHLSYCLDRCTIVSTLPCISPWPIVFPLPWCFHI